MALRKLSLTHRRLWADSADASEAFDKLEWLSAGPRLAYGDKRGEKRASHSNEALIVAFAGRRNVMRLLYGLVN